MQKSGDKGSAWAMFAIPAILVLIGLFVNYVGGKVGVPVRERLGQFESGKVRARFKMPPSGPFHLVLALDKGSKTTFDASTRPAEEGSDGFVQVKEGTNVLARFSLAHADLEPCNWLERDGFGVSYILGWRQSPRLGQLLVPGRVYDVEAHFNGARSTNASLWISCIVANKNRELASGMKLK